MNIFAKLISQTAIYGLSSIVGRFLNYLLVPLYTYYFTAAEYGVVSEFYAYAGFFSVVLLFGCETGYFRFRQNNTEIVDKHYSTILWFIIVINSGFYALINYFQQTIAELLNYPDHPQYIRWFSLILAIDAISSIPLARLRAENRPFRFALVKLSEILITIILSLFFIVYCRSAHSNALIDVNQIYDPKIGVGYIFIANLIASASKLLLLIPQFKGLIDGFNRQLLKTVLKYSLPMVIIGFAGIINEMLDRVLLKQLLPYSNTTNLKLLGIYSACYKLSILMSLFIQAFRYAAEPFFFSYAKQQDAKFIYAKVLKFFVIFCVFIFLMVSLYLDFFQYFIGKEFRVGLSVVPILLLANLVLGIYINLSIWYKLTDKTFIGAMVSLIGAGLTIILNYLWIPIYGYQGSAWATLICYGLMAIISYLLGQRYYPVAYPLKRILSYILLGISLYAIQYYVSNLSIYSLNKAILATELLSIYLLVVYLFEANFISEKNTTNLPVKIQ
ncbi:MAG: hypothetical protein RL637_532, partial [Pseudomonadota bacterium]